MLRTRTKEVIKRCFRTYIERIEEDVKLNIKAFWRYTKSKRITNNIPGRMCYQDKVGTTGEDIVNLFASHFSSIYSSNTTNNYFPSFPSSNFSIGNLQITREELLGKLQSVDLSKGAGFDGIPPIFVRFCATALVTPLLIIFEKSLHEGVFPSLWKIAKVTPVYKSGDKGDVLNYRPICILNLFAKIFEGFIYTHMYNHLKHILSPRQHGFVTGRSTNSNLLCYSTYLCSSFNDKKQVDAIYTDFSKAFDRVDHFALLVKAQHVGIHGNLYRWLSSYLLNRTQLVALSGYESVPFLATSGVPQGSKLGPLLFLLFVNDLLGKISSECLAYADDIKVFRRISDERDCETLQLDINTISAWCDENFMVLNIEKCRVITFTKSRNPIQYKYNVKGILVDRVEVIRDLGVLFDSAMSFRPHYNDICSRAGRMLSFILRTAKPFRRADSLIILYSSLVRTIVEYCSAVWTPIYQTHIDRLEAIQRRFVRALCYKYGLRRKINQYDQRLAHFQMVSLERRRWVSDLCTLHKIANGSFDSCLLERLEIKVPTRSVRIQELFVIPMTDNNVSQNAPLVRMCKYYNAVCAEVDIFHNNICKFKKIVHSKYLQP